MCVTAASLKYELQLASQAETETQSASPSAPGRPSPSNGPMSSPSAPSPASPAPAPSLDPDPKPVPIVWPAPCRLRVRRNRGRQYKEPEPEEPEVPPSEFGATPFTPIAPAQRPVGPAQGQVQEAQESAGVATGQLHPRVQKWMARAEVLAGSAGLGLSPTAIAMARRTAEAQLVTQIGNVDPEKAVAHISKEADKLAEQFKEMGNSAFAQFARSATAGAGPLNGISAEGVRQAAGPLLAEVAQITREPSSSKFKKSAKQVLTSLKGAGVAVGANGKSLGDVKGPAIAAGSLLVAAAQGARSSKSFGKLGLAAGLIGGLVTAGTAMYVQHRQEKKQRQRDGDGGGRPNEEEEDDEGYSEPVSKPQMPTERTGLPVDEFINTIIPILYLHV